MKQGLKEGKNSQIYSLLTQPLAGCPPVFPLSSQNRLPAISSSFFCHPDSGNAKAAKAAILGNYSPISHAAHIPAALMQRIRAKQGIPKTGIQMLSPALPQRQLRAGTCHSILEGFHHDAIRQGGGQQGHLFPHGAEELLGFWRLELHFFEGMGICGTRKTTELQPAFGNCHRFLMKANLPMCNMHHVEERN